jgi:hypothetical protein
MTLLHLVVLIDRAVAGGDAEHPVVVGLLALLGRQDQVIDALALGGLGIEVIQSLPDGLVDLPLALRRLAQVRRDLGLGVRDGLRPPDRLLRLLGIEAGELRRRQGVTRAVDRVRPLVELVGLLPLVVDALLGGQVVLRGLGVQDALGVLGDELRPLLVAEHDAGLDDRLLGLPGGDGLPGLVDAALLRHGQRLLRGDELVVAVLDVRVGLGLVLVRHVGRDRRLGLAHFGGRQLADPANLGLVGGARLPGLRLGFSRRLRRLVGAGLQGELRPGDPLRELLVRALRLLVLLQGVGVLGGGDGGLAIPLDRGLTRRRGGELGPELLRPGGGGIVAGLRVLVRALAEARDDGDGLLVRLIQLLLVFRGLVGVVLGALRYREPGPFGDGLGAEGIGVVDRLLDVEVARIGRQTRGVPGFLLDLLGLAQRGRGGGRSRHGLGVRQDRPVGVRERARLAQGLEELVVLRLV